jgi:D-glycero-alpha-D-manno-heptose 1-phosphate guanylyltransferase
MEYKECIILAGGLGTRLQSAVPDKPKCLADIAGKPFLYYLAQYLKPYHFQHIILAVGHKREMIMDYVENNPDVFPCHVSFSIEEEPLGTGGAIAQAMQFVQTEDVFVLNGDTFFDVDLDAMLAFQRNKMADCTLALKPMLHASRYGLVETDEHDLITTFHEKKENASGLINGGVYCLFKKAFQSIPFPTRFSFETAYLENHLHEREMAGFIQPNYFLDIGIPEDYEKAQTEIPFYFQQKATGES